MQDQFRQPGHPSQPQSHHPSQPLSPAHSAYHPYPPRDSVIKRESGEDPRRSNSAGGHAPDSVPHSTHASAVSHPQQPPPPPPHQPASAYAPEGQHRHMGYENGPSVPPNPGMYRPTSYPPPTPTHQPSFESHASYPQATEPFYGVYTSSAASKKKNTRASQACDQCRQLKAKCDETKPCKTCRDKGTECRYRDPVPKATDKAQADILEGITVVQHSIASLVAQVGRMDNRMTKLEASIGGHANGNFVKMDSVTEEEQLKTLPRSPFEEEPESAHQFYNSGPCRGDLDARVERAPLELMAEDELEAEPGPVVPPGEPAIPINHTTLAGLLLEWPCISDIVKPHLEAEGIRHIKEYPMSHEQSRGILVVYGRGEDAHPSRRLMENPDYGQLDMGDESSDGASPSPAAEWGHLGGLSPADQATEYKGGVLASDGNPDFSEDKVWAPSKGAFAVGSVAPNLATEMTGSKRKRSPQPDGPEVLSTPTTGKSGRPERSIHNALVLCILALGKICLHRDRIYDAVLPVDPLPHGSPSARNGIPPSPNRVSPPSTSSQSFSSGGVAASPKETERGFQSRRSSIHGGSTGTSRGGLGMKKNYEAIPGLEYFAFATDILGNYTGAYKNMKNVYALIFAGLYHGQLARPMESFAFIHQAGHKLQVIMGPSLDKLRRIKTSDMPMIQEQKHNQLALTFWTCLQLESDLIAELRLPPSGLLSYEENMPHPNMSLLRGYDQRVLDSYLAQLYLRTHLNSIHRMFYSPLESTQEAESKDLALKFKNVGLVAGAVSGMRWVAKSYAFHEDDPPADDFLAARLRAKYWGAQVITYRPFIRQILQWSEQRRKHPSSPNLEAVSEFRRGVAAPVIDPSVKSHKDIQPTVIEYAKRGIKALIESTRAFHNLGPKRPVITNVFGTAHAQWGNLLTVKHGHRFSKNRHAHTRGHSARLVLLGCPGEDDEKLLRQYQLTGASSSDGSATAHDDA
ncbi:C6 zinc finger domain-containing protein [Metarhizium album ARSEF 1941]|uniref:C6 zinc finger domain-containing protein n=1 Tax=Metarhizium album (strain ARSEF 1941) TaxID=1081103 RepID=A0A0B2WTZ1_METAS|nr:C6 zinc finger domain-containing protein [Metarhizium album ARSEF 1941]KHN96932.1 C6 zinc finger domain-containing protein [Metarhizium album ARSEF 1941]